MNIYIYIYIYRYLEKIKYALYFLFVQHLDDLVYLY